MPIARSARSTTRRAAAVAVVSLLALTGCGSGSGGSSTTPTAKSSSGTTASTGPSGSSSSSGASNGNDPVGGGSIDLGSSSSSTSYPPSMLSEDLAKDCYSGRDRIYDRYGMTCADATRVLTAYEGTAEGRSGAARTIEKYRCSHNPATMVNQGAAPGTCADANGNVVFNWRYPGAPLPATG